MGRDFVEVYTEATASSSTKQPKLGVSGSQKTSTDRFLQSLGTFTVTLTETQSHDTGNHQGTEDNKSLLREN